MRGTVYFDGGARAGKNGNKGHAGCAIVMHIETTPDTPIESTKYLGDQTNNVAEYEALLLGMRMALAYGVDDLQLVSDSKLVVEQVLGEWEVKNPRLKILCAEAREMATQFVKCEILHVRRELNRHADRLVTKLLDDRSKKKRQ